MFQIQLKQIETAIDQGRLDEAFGLLLASSQRDHRDGQRLTSLLAERLHRRAGDHLADGFLDAARSDANKAKQLAGNQSEIVALVTEIHAAQQGEKMAKLERQDAEAAAKIQVQLGNFTLGQRFLPSPEHQSKLTADIARRRAVATDAAERLELATRNEDWESAIAVLNALDRDVAGHRLVTDKVRLIVEPVAKTVSRQISEGRVDRAAGFLSHIGSLAEAHSELADLRRVIDHCRQAKESIDCRQYSVARQELEIAVQIIGPCDWLAETIRVLASIEEQAGALRTGPLGLLRSHPSSSASHRNQFETVSHVPMQQSPQEKNSQQLLRVDGLGSVLLVDTDVVTIGSSSASKRFDIAIQSDGPSTPIFVRRNDGDYIAESEASFRLNDRPTQRRLLRSGDALAFGRRGRLRFRQPVPASTSAVLDVTGAGLRRREIRQIALMSDSLLFARSGGHFSVETSDRPIVVFRDHDGYAIKYAGEGGEIQRLEIDRPVVLGETRFTLNRIQQL